MEVSVNLHFGRKLVVINSTVQHSFRGAQKGGAPCHKEFRSGRVVAVGVNSIGEEVNVRKVIPPGFIMIQPAPASS